MSLKSIYDAGVAKWGESPAVFTDKDTWHSYLSTYERLFEGRDSIKMLEIGVQTGASLWLWQQYFREKNVTYDITGMDILPTFYCNNPEFQTPVLEDPNIRVLWNTDSTVESSYSNLSTYDIIIDDGLHSVESQLASLKYGLSKLNKGGVFVIEDIVEARFLDMLEDYAKINNPNLKVERYLGMKNGRWDDMMIMFYN